MIWDEDFDPKIRTFRVFEGGGKENGAGVWTDGFCTITVILRYLTQAA